VLLFTNDSRFFDWFVSANNWLYSKTQAEATLNACFIIVKLPCAVCVLGGTDLAKRS
jgi:hypothetical protein